MVNKLVIDLSEPIECNGKTISKLEIGKFKAKHFKFLPEEIFEMTDDSGEQKQLSAKQSIDVAVKMLPLIAALSSVEESAIDELSISDLLEVVNQIAPFLESSLSPRSGEK